MTFCKLLSVLVLIYNTEVSVSIMGGTDAPQGSWPWMVHLNISTYDRRSRWRCGGTLLNSEWVLTAAHCWNGLQQPDFRQSMVWIGTHALQKTSVRYMAIDAVILHPHFHSLSNGFANDIALIKLKKTVMFSQRVAPVLLASPDDVLGSSSDCWIIGWGQIGNVRLPDPEILQELKISLMPQTSCEVERFQTLSRVVLAGDKAGGKDSCGGDNGGPLMCRTARGFVQVGIRSYGSGGGCGLPDSPGVYTRVSKHLCFINCYVHQG
uniref:Peptidase S1 domain-containing protein n=1 Tax=Amphiprion percula TaxID=161767 RepID=A0A3P8TV92_AMPPE